ncbi:hypothetical protein Pelo_6284 [Pelomyxa schiedti]|nr:hypothetical protein Pelo_6284 [Pelomyxa schiedti]
MAAAAAPAVDATLVLRLVWEWITANSRFHCVTWSGHTEGAFLPLMMVTFGVSMALMTLTHDMRWWATRRGEFLLGSSLHYLIVQKGRGLLLLQDRQTGKRIQLVKFPDGNDSVRCETNGRWVVCCDPHSMKMIVVEIPMRKNANGGGATTTPFERPTAVKIDPRWKICAPQFVGVINENHVLLCCHDAETDPTFFEFVAARKKGGYFITIEEGTGKLGRAFPESERSFADLRVSQVSQSQFCVMDDDSDFPVNCYSVWDVNNTGSEPVRKQQCLSGCTTSQAFVEGGLLFQVRDIPNPSICALERKEIHVTDEATGADVITLWLCGSLDTICAPQFVGVINENHVLLCCHDAETDPTFFEFVLVDLVETCSSERLAVLSSTVPRLSDLPPSLGRFESFVSKHYHVFRKQHCEGGGGSTNHLFVMREGAREGGYFITIEEGTGKLGRAFLESERSFADLRVSQCGM